jgi:hypothetical protein
MERADRADEGWTPECAGEGTVSIERRLKLEAGDSSLSVAPRDASGSGVLAGGVVSLATAVVSSREGTARCPPLRGPSSRRRLGSVPRALERSSRHPKEQKARSKSM